jgi:ferredoxin-NADP reductase
MAKAPPIQSYKLLRRFDQSHDVFELTFDRPQEVTFKAGQFISIIIPGAGPNGRDLRRAYSIASSPDKQSVFELSIKLVPGGPGTTYLNSLKVGQEIRGQFPMGDFVVNHPPEAPTFFIGTGTGVAPHRSMILSSAHDWTKAPVGFLLGVRAEEDIIYPELFGDDRPAVLRSQKHVKICLSRPKDPAAWGRNQHGFQGRVTDYLRSLNDWQWQASHYYLCGSGAMIQEVQDWLMNEKAVDKTHIHKEAYFK